MSDQDFRRLLLEVIDDIDAGRVDVRPRRYRLARLIGAPLVAATLGLSAGACSNRNVGTHQDAEAPLDDGTTADDGGPPIDAAAVDGGNIDLYGIIIEDAAVDAAVDGEIPLPYAAPPITDFTRSA